MAASFTLVVSIFVLLHQHCDADVARWKAYCSGSWGVDYPAHTTPGSVDACKAQCSNSQTCVAISYGRSDGNYPGQCVLCTSTHATSNSNWDTYPQAKSAVQDITRSTVLMVSDLEVQKHRMLQAAAVASYIEHPSRMGCHSRDRNLGFIGLAECPTGGAECVEKGREACDYANTMGTTCIGFAVRSGSEAQIYGPLAINKDVCRHDDGLYYNEAWTTYLLSQVDQTTTTTTQVAGVCPVMSIGMMLTQDGSNPFNGPGTRQLFSSAEQCGAACGSDSSCHAAQYDGSNCYMKTQTDLSLVKSSWKHGTNYACVKASMWYYAADGAPSIGDSPATICASSVSAAAATRCCSSDGSCISVCDEPQYTTYAIALERCQSLGRRLCTQAELSLDVCMQTGCDFDNLLVWTSDVCQACARPVSGCGEDYDVYATLDCDGDGILDHKCTTTIDSKMWLVLSTENCPNSWGSSTRSQSECMARKEVMSGTTTTTTATAVTFTATSTSITTTTTAVTFTATSTMATMTSHESGLDPSVVAQKIVQQTDAQQQEKAQQALALANRSALAQGAQVFNSSSPLGHVTVVAVMSLDTARNNGNSVTFSIVPGHGAFAPGITVPASALAALTVGSAPVALSFSLLGGSSAESFDQAVASQQNQATEQRRPAPKLTGPPVSASLFDEAGNRLRVQFLPEPIRLIIAPNATEEMTCVFWNETLNMWDDTGVVRVEHDGPELICATTHLSVFGAVTGFFSEIGRAFECSNGVFLFSEAAANSISRTNWTKHTPAGLLMALIGVFIVLTLVVTWLDYLEAKRERGAPRPFEYDEEKAIRIFSWTCLLVLTVCAVYVVLAGGRKDASFTVLGAGGAGLLGVLMALLCINLCGLTAKQSKVTPEIPTCTHQPAFSEARGQDAGVLDEETNATMKACGAIKALPERFLLWALKLIQAQVLRVAPDSVEFLVKAQKHDVAASNLTWLQYKSKAVARDRDLAAHREQSLDDFLATAWHRRCMGLAMALHPVHKVLSTSVIRSRTARIMLIGLKILAASAATALWFASDSISDTLPAHLQEKCSKPRTIIMNIVIGFVSTILSDGALIILLVIHGKPPALRELKTKVSEAREKMRKAQIKSRLRLFLFWVILLIYASVCMYMIIAFLASVSEKDGLAWFAATGWVLVEVFLLSPVKAAVVLGSAISVLLACQPAIEVGLRQTNGFGHDRARQTGLASTEEDIGDSREEQTSLARLPESKVPE